jgi:hypothetical protein
MIEHHIVGAGNMVTPADKNRGSFSRLESWLDLLSMANFAERHVTVAGATLVLRPGQTLAGRAFLARRWNWTEKAVRVWLLKLEAELMISLACEKLKEGQTKGHGPNVLTVCNWSKFQIEPSAEGPGLGWTQGHPRATQGPHYNKGTREQEDKRVNAREAQTDGRGYWSTAMTVPGGYDPNEGVHYDKTTGLVQLVNGVRLHWVEQFGGDEQALDLALKQAANYIQPNAYKPIKTQVEAQLAGMVRTERERTKRYEGAKTEKPKGESPAARIRRLAADIDVGGRK